MKLSLANGQRMKIELVGSCECSYNNR